MISNIIEYTVLLGLGALQFIFAWSIWAKILHYRDIFKVMPSVIATSSNDDSEIATSNHKFLKAKHDNSTIITITKSINDYLNNNNGVGIDYHLIKDIVDRNVDVVANDIENKVPAPLYIGLAGTMLGIIIGLFNINLGVDTVTTDTSLSDIEPLIDGVKSAMSISVLGLIITTTFSVKIFKDANNEVETAKNKFLSILQTQLLPKVNNSKLPEIEVLSNKLDNFSKTAIKVLDGIENSIKATSNTLDRESDILDKINEIDVKSLSRSNVDTFNKLSTMMESIEVFSTNFSELSDSLSSTNNIAINLREFVENTKQVTAVLELIKKNVADSTEMQEYFHKHIKSFENYGNAVNEAVTNADSRMAKAVAKISEVSMKEMNAISEGITIYQQELSKSFEFSVSSFEKSITEQVKRTEEAFEKGRPKFEKLDQLDNISDKLSSLPNDIASVLNEKNSKIESLDNEFIKQTEGLKTELSNKLERNEKVLEAILEELRLRKNSKNGKENKTDYSNSHENSEEKKINNRQPTGRKKLVDVLLFWKPKKR